MYDPIKSEIFPKYSFDDWQVWIKLMLFLDKLDIKNAKDPIEEFYS